MVEDIEKSVTMPEPIAKAVCQVMSKIGVLGKDNKNKFDNYDYASIDDFIIFVREHCVEAGLFIIPQEAREPEDVEMKKKDGTPLLMWRARFGFILVSKCGATYGPIYKTVKVQSNGAQAAGASQSYALKQLMRGLFMIPTGDKDDPDVVATDLASPNQEQSSLQVRVNKFLKSIKAAKDEDKLVEVWEMNMDIKDEMKEETLGFLSKAFDKKKIELRKKGFE